MKQKIIIIFLAFFTFYGLGQDNEMFFQGVKQFNAHKYSEAISTFEAYKKKFPGLSVDYYLATCYFYMENFEQAAKLYGEIIEEYEYGVELGWSWLNRATSFREMNQIDSAFYCYNVAAQKYPESGAYYNLSELYRQTKEFQKSKDALDQAIQLDSLYPLYYVKRMEIYFILHNFEPALADLKKAASLDENYYMPANEAYCYSMLNRFEEADSIYQIIYDEEDAIFLNNYGFNKHKMGNSKKGLAFIEKSILINPSNAYAHRNRALIYLDLGQVSDACESLNKAKYFNFSSQYGPEVDELINEHCSE